MWAGRAPSRPDPPYLLTLPDLLPRLHIDIGKVKVHADQAVAVVDEDRIARVEKVLRQCHRSIGRSEHLRAERHRIVAAHVWLH